MAMMSLRPGESVILESKDCTWEGERSIAGSWPAHPLADRYPQCQQTHERNNSQRNHTINTPDPQHLFFNVRQVERKPQRHQRKVEQSRIRPFKGQST